MIQLLSNKTPSSYGVKFQAYNNKHTGYERLEIHRNGTVNYRTYFESENNDRRMLEGVHLSIKLMYILEFASYMYQNYNYFGDVKIICQLQPLDNSWLKPLVNNSRREINSSEADELIISRDFPSNMLESKYSFIASGIMDEIFNNYQFWKCPYFNNRELIDLSKL
jgi:hypothetical protein